jgi:radical SAM superfamily enzyme YgiQ (UPF0313 family)
MNPRKQRMLFLQLPRLDNESTGPRENLPIAGFYLLHALEKGGGKPQEARFLTPEEEELDDKHLLEGIVDWKPDVIAATLYLWNIERTLHLLRKVRKKLPFVKTIAGGPEVAHHHPFLFKTRVFDVVVVGEGELVFPLLIKALQKGRGTDFSTVAWRSGHSYAWGTKPVPAFSIRGSLPPPGHAGWQPDRNGMVYLETGRGCPLSCTYCRYGHLRPKTSFLNADEVKKRLRILMDRGAKEIRFIDPVFNANPEFPSILKSLRGINRHREIKLFAEIQADLLTDDQIALLSAAGFNEVEAGVQSLNPLVLKRIHRPVRFSSLDNNLRLLTQKGIKVTIDLMYGLPGQRLQDVEKALQWAWKFTSAYVQCFQTLLLPGTELREMRRRWKIEAHRLPPYGVCSSETLTPEDVFRVEEMIHQKSPAEAMTRRFVGTRLPDLFRERVFLPVDGTKNPRELQGKKSRRALFFSGANLFAHRRDIAATIRRAILAEPHMLWQFVLNPEEEEPLDLLAEMIAEIRKHSSHWIDRFAYVAGWNRIASRRILVLLKRSRPYSPSWIKATESLLEDHFY